VHYRVVVTHHRASCFRCDEPIGVGEWLRLTEDARRLCLACAELDHLEFLEAGNASLTRRATRESAVVAIVVEWSTRWKRWERQGILVELDALWRAEDACGIERSARVPRTASYVRAFAGHIRAAFPNCPPARAHAIAEHACARGSGRIGLTPRAKSFDAKAIHLAVRAHVRHEDTRYDALLAEGKPVWAARRAVKSEIDLVLARWRGEHGS
jgi:hypothetical protein